MSLSRAEVWAVVVNWNGGSRNLACVQSLLDAGLAHAQIVFVDNGSSDGSLELVRGEHPGLSFVENERNLGFAAASSAESTKSPRTRMKQALRCWVMSRPILEV